MVLFVDVDVFKEIATKGIDFEVFNFSAYRLLYYLMRNRQPWSLLLEYDLCLLIELCAFGLIGG
ncbi:hypothetical protein D3C71_2228220 [compost metagenome]